MPTMMAACLRRSACTRSRAAGPVIQRDAPLFVAIFAIERHGVLQRDVRRAMRDEVEEDGVEASHSALRDALVDCDASCAKLFAASSCDKRIGVGRPTTSACDARFDDGFGARGLLAGVAAWFEGYVEGRAFGRDISSSAVGRAARSA